MATQGLVTVTKGGQVLMKFIAGSDGDAAVDLAAAIREWREPPSPLSNAYDIALAHGFGTKESLVVMNREDVEFRGDEDLDKRYRETFDQPRFNPRWDVGTADYVEVVEL